MILTDIEIKDMMYDFIKDSTLMNVVTGKLYKDQRPLNPTKEDVVISVVARDGRQIQSFVVNVNVFVPDLKRGQEFIEDTKRLRTLSILCSELFEDTVFDRFNLRVDYQAVSEVNGADFHCITNRLNIEVFTPGLRRI